MKLSLKHQLSEVNKELWLVLSMISIIGIMNYLVTGHRMLLGLYTLPTLFSAYFYGRKHAVLTAFASILLVVWVPHALYAQESKKDIQLQTIAFKLFQEKENLKILRSQVVEKNNTAAVFDEQPLSYYSLMDSIDRIYILCGYEYEILEIAPKLKKGFKPKYYQRRNKQLLQTIDGITTELNTIDMLFKETQNRSIINLVDQTKKSIQSILSLMEYGVKILEPESN